MTGSPPMSLIVAADPGTRPAGTTMYGKVTLSAPGQDSVIVKVVASVVATPPPPPPPPAGLDEIVYRTWAADPARVLSLRWRSEQVSAAMRYRPAGESDWLEVIGTDAQPNDKGYLLSASARGLTPGTQYEYQVETSTGTWTAPRAVRTAPDADGELRLGFVADTGIAGRTDGLTTGTLGVRDALAAANLDGVLVAGDLAYFNSETRFATLDLAIDAWYEQMAPVSATAALLPSYGNHEVYLGEGYEQWADRLPVPPNSTDDGRFWSIDVGELHLVSVFAPGDVTVLTQAELTWLDNDLAAARARGQQWIVPFMHVSSFAIGTNHRSNTTVRAQLAQIFERHDVPIVLQAHDQAFVRTFPLRQAATTPTVTSTDSSCYDDDEGTTWVTVSPGGKLSNQNSGFSPYVGFNPSWDAARDNTMHHWGELTVTDRQLAFTTYGLPADGQPIRVTDTFAYAVDGDCSGD